MFPKTILVVDDDSDLCSALEISLRAEFPDYDIESIGNGKTAWEMWQKTHHSIVVLDMMLPGMSGFLVMGNILKYRQGNRTEWPIVIMITAMAGARHKMFGESLGVNGYMIKPLKHADLMAKIREEIRKKSA